MLELKNIKKFYTNGDEKVEALKGINLTFRDSEFVSILGQSGCGKTTLLNIIGGLDRYSDGDLIINGKTTKEFKDREWDSYRNYSVGFIFQSYNLIPHQSVLANVEMALTISGYSKNEKRKKAIKALEDVGLKEQIYKKPNQLSGGQMQRVAIARAIVNDPDIILADEPTGALDTKTSVQIMDLLKEISKDKLIIMVTHNPNLAEEYSNRIIKLIDGTVIEDTNSYNIEEGNITDKKNISRKTQMKFTTALRLSLNNLMTKKARTILTAFAGSVGIIGIAAILSLSSGVRNYISKIEEDTLSSYPITIEKETVDMSTLMQTMMEENTKEEKNQDNLIKSRNIMTDIISTVSQEVQSNNLEEFKKYLETNEEIKNNTNAIQYSYELDLNIYNINKDGEYVQSNPSQVMNSFGEMGGMIESRNSLMSSSSMMSTDIWKELLDNKDLLKSQYDIVAGKFPENFNEAVLILDKNNEISDYTLYSLGLKDSNEVTEMFEKIKKGEKVEEIAEDKYSYEEILNLKYKLLLNSDYYKKENGIWIDKSNDKEFMKKMLEDSLEINIVGIIRPNAQSNIISTSYGEVGYLSDLTKYVIEKINNSEIVKEQLENNEINVFTGTKFLNNSTSKTATGSTFSMDSLTNEQKIKLSKMSKEEQLEYISAYTQNSASSYDENIKKLGIVDLESPSSINIYPIDFESKENIKLEIENYNKIQQDDGKDENKIEYTDLVGTLMNSVTKIVNIISYVLIAFVAISLVVSSIMIAIITYISVLERIKEIGILRAMGTSKKDISKIFNAETFIEGLIAGLLGIGVTIVLNIPVNLIVNKLLGIETISSLPVVGGIVLVIISVILTVIAGLIPAKLAAKKDPAVVLRSE